MPVVLTPGAVWFGAAVTFAFLFSFSKTFRTLFEPLMLKIAGIGFGGVNGHFGAYPFGFLKTIVHNVNEWTNQGMAGCERAMSWSIETMRASLHELSLTLQSMAENYKAAFDNAWHAIEHVVPKVVRQTIVRPVEKAAHYSDAKLRARVGALAGAIAALKLRVGHLTHEISGAVAHPLPRLGRLERTKLNTKDLHKWLKRTLLGTLGATIVLAQLRRLGLGWLRCRNVNKVGKTVCGMNPLGLEALLLAALPLAMDFNLREFVGEMQTVTEDAAKLIQKLAD